jgi:hypothetical protein
MAERRIEYVLLSTIEAAPRNPKQHAMSAIRASIDRFGLGELPLIDERTGRLVAGHGRLDDIAERHRAGQHAPDGVRLDDSGNWLVPVIRGWASRSDAEAEAYLVASNKLTTRGGWDNEALAEVLSDLSDQGLLELSGFTDAELAALAGDSGDEFGPVDDEQARLDQRAPIMCPQCSFEWRVGPRGEIQPV